MTLKKIISVQLAICVFLFASCQSNEEKFRSEAVHFINTLEECVNSVGVPGDNLSKYAESLNVQLEENGNKIQPYQLDSLESYYNTLKAAYDHAIAQANALKNFNGSDSLKAGYIKLLRHGKNSYQYIFPALMMKFKSGQDSTEHSSSKLHESKMDEYYKSVDEGLAYSRILAVQVTAFVRKYRLRYYNFAYK